MDFQGHHDFMKDHVSLSVESPYMSSDDRQSSKMGSTVTLLICVQSPTLQDAYRIGFEQHNQDVSISTDYGLIDGGTSKLQDFSPDLIIIDPQNAQFNYAESLYRLKSSTQEFPWVMLTSRADINDIRLALDYRAKGFLTWDLHLEQIADLIIQLALGQLHSHWSAAALEWIDRSQTPWKLKEESGLDILTQRQIQVLTYLAEGKSVKEIARIMKLSQKSVDSHKYRIMKRLHLHDRVHLARFAIRNGLIEA